LIGLTLNNLSCSYKRNGQIEEAQKPLTKALEIQALAEEQRTSEVVDGQNPVFEKSQRDGDDRFNDSPRNSNNEQALTELNLCAIYSQQGDHMKAKMYAHSSIYKLKQELEHIKAQIQQLQSRDADVSVELLNSAREKQSLCAIAHYNLGSQQEFLKEYPKALESYRQALILEKTKNDFQGLRAVAPSPLINEF